MGRVLLVPAVGELCMSLEETNGEDDVSRVIADWPRLTGRQAYFLEERAWGLGYGENGVDGGNDCDKEFSYPTLFQGAFEEATLDNSDSVGNRS